MKFLNITRIIGKLNEYKNIKNVKLRDVSIFKYHEKIIFSTKIMYKYEHYDFVHYDLCTEFIDITFNFSKVELESRLSIVVL